MKIYRAVKTNRLNQTFGDNLSCVKTNNGIPIRPFQVITKNNTCPIGYVDFYTAIGMSGHNGEDWAIYHGEPIYFNIEANTKWFARTEVDADGGVGLDVISVDPISFTDQELPLHDMPSLRLIQCLRFPIRLLSCSKEKRPCRIPRQESGLSRKCSQSACAASS